MPEAAQKVVHTIDIRTKNTSFIKVYKLLKKMGITNNKFFLRLYDKKLVGVDPYSKNLTQEQKARIVQECMINPWYFIREVVRVKTPRGNIPYELNRGNLALTWGMINNLNIIMMLPRQHGKTISTLCMYAWLFLFGAENSEMLFFNKEFKYSKLNLKRLGDIINIIPDYLKLPDRKNDKDNAEELFYSARDNSITAMASATNPEEADKKGRGSTTPLQYWDEKAFLKYNKIMRRASAPATTKAMEEAEKGSKPYGITITTTPNNLDLEEGAYVKSMINDAYMFDEFMYDLKNRDEIVEKIESNSKNRFMYIEFSYKQLGRDEKWFKKQCADLDNDMLTIKREILLEWTFASDNSVYTEDQLEILSKYHVEPIGNLLLMKYYEIKFLKDIDFNKPWVIGVDPAAGLSRDSSCIEITDPYTFEIVGEFKNNTIDTNDFTMLVHNLMTHYFKNSLLVIERNSYGQNMLDFLMKTNIEKNLYFEYKEKKGEKVIQDVRANQHKKMKKKVKVYGVYTTETVRGQMLDILTDTINHTPSAITSKNVFSNIKTLERNNRGKIEHRRGEHDDNMMAYLLARFVLAFGENLSKWLSLNSSETMDEQKDKKRLKFNNISAANRPTTQLSLSQKFINEEQVKASKKSASRSSIGRILAMNGK